MTNQSRMLAPKRLVIAAAVTAIVVAGGTAIHNIVTTPPQHFSTTQTIPSVSQQPLQLSTLDQVLQTLGPFTPLPASNSSTPDTNYPALLLVRQDGSVESSVWTIPFTPSSWSKSQAIQITNLSVVGDYATFSTGPSRVYTVRTEQPFILEAVPQYVMVIDASGQQWSTNVQSAYALRHSF